MNQGRLRLLGAVVLAAAVSSMGAKPAAAQLKVVSGKLAGVVRDTAGTPQMGASVEVIAEATSSAPALAFLTNTQGVFRGDRLAPGLYTVRVTLAGFLPTLEKHVRINANLTTMVRIQLESMFASLEQLRRQPSSSANEADDWKWVLRSAAVMRPVLQWVDDEAATDASLNGEDGQPGRARARIEFRDGARRPGSVSNLPPAPHTAFAYDQKLGGTSRLLLAGQMSFEGQSRAGGIATVWLPTGSLGAGPHTALAMREAKLGPDGPTFRGARIDQGGSMALGDRAVLRYGGEYVLVGLGHPAASLRPRLEVETRVSDDWRVALIFASLPTGPTPLEAGESEAEDALAAALAELDAFPALLWRAGRPVLESGLHEELAVERKLGGRSKLQIAGFHEDNRHIAVFGRGNDLPPADYFQDTYSNGFAYDGGSSSSWGTRVALREKLSDEVELTALYAFAGALTPLGGIAGPLREAFQTQGRHSFGAGVSGRVPRLGAKVKLGYKWVNGLAVSRVDSFGESQYQIEPYLHVGMRQPLPRFALGRWEASADCDNLLAQGYVTLNTGDGRATLMPAFRTFRGGLSWQF